MKNLEKFGVSALVFGGLLAGCSGGTSVRPSGGGILTSPPVLTLAGGAESGNADGAPGVARFNNPVNVATATDGSVYVADFDGNSIRKIAPNGTVSTVVRQANFERPFGLAVTPDGRLFAQTDANDSLARDTTTGTLWQVNLSTGGATVLARNLGRPRGLAALSNAQLVLVDLAQNDVRIFDIGARTITPLAGARGVAGFANGTGNAARFSRPYGPAITRDGNILLADQTNNALRLVTPSGVVTTFAGGVAGFRDGALSAAQFQSPQDVDIDSGGNIFVSDNANHRIRRIAPDGQVSTFAGDGVAGFRDGSGINARFFGQEGLALSRDGRSLFVADGNSGEGGPFNRVRKLGVQ